ncbi:phosphate ABC transporter permease [Spiroplasma sp. NBRC 100390]|uniref:phosphate ABC transporter permease n=1 Tax=unclassified Spiroplasma TaxID=2637901 RepID=UPI000892844D|nr:MULTISPECIES: ABC transporter permease subunit [unclassified Spiroplasma]AOX43964.1 phosphate ABC transporter permease [Spiroplasma sp. TU-14]APE13434.1 phosphate ABC transporter permease [Spiroplasma sp. NBRC 100390]
MHQINSNVFKRKQITDRLAKVIITLFSLCGIIAVLLIIYFIVASSIPALRYQGFWKFLTGTKWVINNETGEYQFGALAFIIGTILVLTLAIIIAAPLAILTALFVTEFLSPRLRAFIIFIIELLAGIPPVLFAVFGRETIGMLFVRMGASGPTNLLTAGVILAFLALPTIFALSANAFLSVPKSYRFAALAMGASRTYTAFKVVKKAAKTKIIGAVIFGMCRVIGEVTAMILLTGMAAQIPNLNEGFWKFLFSPIATLATQIGIELPEHVASLHRSALFALGLVLLIMVSILNLIILTTYKIQRQKERGKHLIPGLKRKHHQPLTTMLTEANYSSELSQESFRALINKKITTNYYNKTMNSWRIFWMILTCLLTLSFSAWIILNIISNGFAAVAYLSQFDASAFIGYYELPPLIISTFMLIFTGTFLSIPIGIITAIYLSEYARKNSRLVTLIQFSTDALVATPSIVFAIFGYVVLVVGLQLGHNFWSAGLMFFVMTLPIIIRVVEDALRNVPQEYRDAALALGTSKIGMVCKVALPNAKGGIVTGVIFAISKIITETAPVLIILTSSPFIPTGFNDIGTTLTVKVFQLVNEPGLLLVLSNYLQVSLTELTNHMIHHLSFIIILFVLALNIFVKIIGSFENNRQPKWWTVISTFIKCYCGSLLGRKNAWKKQLQKSAHSSNKTAKITAKIRNYNEQLLIMYQTKLTKLKKEIESINHQKKQDNYQLSITALEHKIENLEEEMG